MFRCRFAARALDAVLLGAAVLALVVCGPGPARADKPAAKNNTEDGLGYSAAFDAELKKLGPITPKEFAERYALKAKYLDKLSWDPTTAKFYELFDKDPRKANPNVRPGVLNDDFRLNEAELAAFKKNGFVVSERLGTDSFAEMYYRIFSRDLPVYVSADAVLHAWHRTYDSMLMEVELTALAPALAQVLDGMAAAVPAANKDYGKGVMSDGVSDADYFLAVARSLLAGRQAASHLGQDERVAGTLRACDALQLMKFNLFGRKRMTDFSQFKPRGHYDKTEELRRYFRAMMWCGRIDLRVAGHPEEASPREMAGALVLHDLLKRSDGFTTWGQFDKVLQTFVGRTDSMTFAQLGGVLEAAKIKSPADVKDLDMLSAIQEKVLDGTIGVQHIRGDVYVSPFGLEKCRLPRSFTVLGQKFVLDSWALSKVVYDDIIWDEDKVQRRVPSGLDAAFAALGNDAAVPALVERMNKGSRRFRDALNYQHNLAAVRNVIDSQKPQAWDENLYLGWLATLRELSSPTTGAKFPESMRTQPWAMKSLNTQLASWTQLRHDTILYVKQSYTGVPACEYPAGYVEPLPHFWARLEKTVGHAAELIEKTTYPDRTYVPTEDRIGSTGRLERKGEKVTLRGKEKQDQQAKFLRNFAMQVAVLRGIAEKELAEKELSATEAHFLKEVVQTLREGSGSTRYGGWYPALFYQGRTDCGVWDAICADVHTDPPADMIGDPGCVLHQGVGNVDYLLIAVDSGKDRMVYAGPVLSHYEFEMAGVNRKSDSEWRKDIREGKLPPRPEWTRGYLVPGRNQEAQKYRHPDDRP